MTKTKKIILIVDIIILTIFTMAVMLGKTIVIDEWVFKTLHEITDGKYIDFFKVFTELGSSKGIAITSIIILIVLFKKGGINNFINIVSITIINQSAKFIIRRERPEWKLIEHGGYSYPSGHSMATFCLYGYLIFLANKYIKNKYLKYMIYLICGWIIFLIGMSRIYLGVHYVSDVIGGYLITLAFLLIVTSIEKNIKIKIKL